MAGFKVKRNQLGLPTPELERLIVSNSETVLVGGLVRIKSQNGFVEPVAATEGIYGLCVGLVTKDGIPLERAENGTDYDGTFTDGVYGVKSYLASSDNQTDKQVKAVVRPLSHFDVLTNEPDATIGTTAGSNLAGYLTDITSSVQVSESGAGTGTAQLFILGVDGDDSSRGLYRVHELQGASAVV